MRRNQLTNNISRKGYDTCAVLLHCLVQGASNPNVIVETLESVRDFRGLSSLFNIDPESHMNTAIEFVQVVNGEYIKVDRNIMSRSGIK